MSATPPPGSPPAPGGPAGDNWFARAEPSGPSGPPGPAQSENAAPPVWAPPAPAAPEPLQLSQPFPAPPRELLEQFGVPAPGSPAPAYQAPAYQAPGNQATGNQAPIDPGPAYQPPPYPGSSGSPAAASSPPPSAELPYAPPGSGGFAPSAGGPRHSAAPPDPIAYGAPYGSSGAPPLSHTFTGPGGMAAPSYATFNSRSQRSVGVVGLVISTIGAALVVVSFLALNWLSGSNGAGGRENIKFSDFHELYSDESPTIPRLYFNWLGWALLAAVLVCAVLGNAPTRLHAFWRVLGIVIGFGSVAVTFFALYHGISLSALSKIGSAGFWLALAGFFIAGIGAAIGPRRA